MDEDAERAWAIIAHRCPEALDYVVSYEIFALVIETIDALEDRTEALQQAVDALREGESYPSPHFSN
jgi:hypothetical protein